MNILTTKLTEEDYSKLLTEISFNISSARALGKEILIINAFDDKFNAITSSRIIRILRLLKKNNFVNLFVSKKEYENESATAEYLKNKYPELQNYLYNEKDYFIVKI